MGVCAVEIAEADDVGTGAAFVLEVLRDVAFMAASAPSWRIIRFCGDSADGERALGSDGGAGEGSRFFSSAVGSDMEMCRPCEEARDEAFEGERGNVVACSGCSDAV